MIFNYYKNRFYINLAVIFLFFILIVAFVVYPALVEINRANAEIMAERAKLQQKLAMGLNIKKIARDLENIKEPAKKLDEIFIAKGDELEFVNQLEKMAGQNGIDIRLNSDFISQNAKPGVNRVEIQMGISGDYQRLIGFMDELEKIKTYVNLTTLIFAPDSKSSSAVNAQLTGNIYFK